MTLSSGHFFIHYPAPFSASERHKKPPATEGLKENYLQIEEWVSLSPESKVKFTAAWTGAIPDEIVNSQPDIW